MSNNSFQLFFPRGLRFVGARAICKLIRDAGSRDAKKKRLLNSKDYFIGKYTDMMRTIDVHTHVYLPRYINLLRARTAVPRIFTKNNSERLVILPNEDSGSTSNGRPIGPVYSDPKLKLKFMDSHNISTSILSLANPWLDFLPANEAEPIASLLNDDLQQMCLGEERFKGFGVLPTISAEGSMNELENIKSHSELVGVIMGTHGLGKGLDDVLLEPVFKKAAGIHVL